MAYKSSCRACDHKHDGIVCNWGVAKRGRITLKLVYSESLWGISSALHNHGKDKEGNEIINKVPLDTYHDETFDYEQETDCGCKCYIPSENLEYLEWKYDESK